MLNLRGIKSSTNSRSVAGNGEGSDESDEACAAFTGGRVHKDQFILAWPETIDREAEVSPCSEAGVVAVTV